MQALAFAGSFHFAKSGPPLSYRDARSRDRERGLSKLSGVDELYMYMFILRDPIGSFSDWQRYGPARAHSGAPLFCLNTAEPGTDLEFSKRCPHFTAPLYGRADSQNFWRLEMRTLFCRSNRPSSGPCVAVFISVFCSTKTC